MTGRKALRALRAPDEFGAEERAWSVVRSAYRDAAPAATAREKHRRLAAAPAVAAVLAALLLSPAGASVRRWISHTLGVPHAARTLESLPAPGHLLLSGGTGTWTVGGDGSIRRVGPWQHASWSPHGLYLAVVGPAGLAAVDPHGTTHWLLARPDVRDPRWYQPWGYRVAYLSGGQLRIVAGDGTADRLLDANVAGVAPAWQPGHPYRLAYMRAGDKLLVREADTGQTLWVAKLRAPVRELGWSVRGDRLLVAGGTFVRVYDDRGTLLASARVGPVVDAALAPDGRSVALIRGGAVQGAVLLRLTGRHPQLEPLLSGAGLRQVAWAPNGRWLLVSWPRADQWVFVRVLGRPRIAAVSRIAQDFASGRGRTSFPVIDGWCCTADGSAG